MMGSRFSEGLRDGSRDGGAAARFPLGSSLLIYEDIVAK
jgi:hypothetical protein